MRNQSTTIARLIEHTVSPNAPFDIDYPVLPANSAIWVAIARCPLVGIDVESAVAPADYRDLVRGFHRDEIAALQMDGGDAALRRCWNRKEAVAKAIGMGLS